MNNDRIRKYDELGKGEKEVLDAFRQMKLISDYNKFRLYKYKVEDLINDYEQLKKLREEIQAKYFAIYEELINEDLIEGKLDASVWGITREQENEIWDSELRLMSNIKREFDVAIAMIESGEASRPLLMMRIICRVNDHTIHYIKISIKSSFSVIETICDNDLDDVDINAHEWPKIIDNEILIGIKN